MTTTLNVSGLGISCLEGMPVLITIDRLDISGNKLQSFYGLPSLPTMRTLDARHCLITTFAGMSLQPSLTELLLEGNPLVLHPHVGIMALLAVGDSLERIDGRLITAAERQKAHRIGASESFAAMCVSLGLTSLNVSDGCDDRFYRELLPVLKNEYVAHCSAHVDRLHSYQAVLERLHGDPRNPAQWIVVAKEPPTAPTIVSKSVVASQGHSVVTPPRSTVPLGATQQRHHFTPTQFDSNRQQLSGKKLTRHDMNVGLGRASPQTRVLPSGTDLSGSRHDTQPSQSSQSIRSIESLLTQREGAPQRDYSQDRVALELTPREMQCFSIMMLDNLSVTLKPGAWTARTEEPIAAAGSSSRLLLEDAVLRLSFSDGCVSVFESPRQISHHSAQTNVFRTPVTTVRYSDMLNVVLREVMDVGTASSKYVVTVLLTSTVKDTNEKRQWTEMDVTPMKFQEIDAARGIFKALMMMKCTASELAELYQ